MGDIKTISVPEAGKEYFYLGRNASYAAVQRGDIPTIRIGRLLRVPVIALERMLEEAGRAALTRHEPVSDASAGSKRPARLST